MPTGRKWKGMPVPFFANEEAAEAFQALETSADDVICASPVKAGTTWVHRILMLMLHGLDDAGQLIEPASDVVRALLKSQIYPDALPMTAPSEPSFMGGLLSYPDLLAMAAPRLFTTHFPGQLLPAKIGRYPVDQSVYGVRDLAGNMRDWTTSVAQARHETPAGERVQGPRAPGNHFRTPHSFRLGCRRPRD